MILDDASNRFARSPMAAALLFRSAEAALKLGNKNDARARFLRASEAETKDAWAEDALIRAARLALDQGDAKGADELAESFVTRFPKSALRADARLVSAHAALKADKPKEAIAILTESLAEDHPSPPTAQAETYYLGLAYSKDGQSARASELLDRLAKTPAAPAAADAQFLVGQAHVEAGRYSEGVSALESYLKGKPDGDVVDYALAHLIQARIGLGELDAVFETLGRLSAKFPRSKVLDVSRVRAGEAALGAKQYERATEQFRLASESADPFTASRARLGLGWTLLDSGKADEAAASFGAFLASAPRDNSDAPEASLARARRLKPPRSSTTRSRPTP